ncbi:uncharacterized protein LOC109864165 isoform X1 [Pseudomyrmex gracilis]|uniref:uncharacterized protein LOC109864165 isoform X1 n=1 Tax=Pseudomyrmex gracilis TaxID=219809 RepID=UPI000994FA12|nr:uncharacterized protein LOC109864165 isoform X1 [Pseudomyrmex gracilis]
MTVVLTYFYRKLTSPPTFRSNMNSRTTNDVVPTCQPTIGENRVTVIRSDRIDDIESQASIFRLNLRPVDSKENTVISSSAHSPLFCLYRGSEKNRYSYPGTGIRVDEATRTRTST